VLVNPDADPLDGEAFPDVWHHRGHELELAYEFDPESHLDGVSVLVPIELLNQLDQASFRWSVPGLRTELVEAMIRSLPKASRRLFVPAAETAAEVAAGLDPGQGDLVEVLADRLGKRAGTIIPVEAFDFGRVPVHLRPTFRVINDRYELLAEGKDLAELSQRLAGEMRSTLTQLVAVDTRWEREGIRTWDFGLLPRVVEAGHAKAYPALVDGGDSVAIRLLASEPEQADAMWLGVRRLLRLNVAAPVRTLDRLLDPGTKLRLVNGHVQSKAEWYNDAIDCAIDAIIADAGGPPWDEAGFVHLAERTRAELPELLEEIAAAMGDLVEALSEIHERLDRLGTTSYQLSLDDVRAHLGRLAYPGFVAGIGHQRLADVHRYLQAIARRLDGLVRNPTYDLEALAICRRLDNELTDLANRRNRTADDDEQIEKATWMLEELRVSMFAQSLGTNGKVSEKRVRRALNRLRAPTPTPSPS
jgi:ATP-dependent helicase HrpA